MRTLLLSLGLFFSFSAVAQNQPWEDEFFRRIWTLNAGQTFRMDLKPTPPDPEAPPTLQIVNPRQQPYKLELTFPRTGIPLGTLRIWIYDPLTGESLFNDEYVFQLNQTNPAHFKGEIPGAKFEFILMALGQAMASLRMTGPESEAFGGHGYGGLVTLPFPGDFKQGAACAVPIELRPGPGPGSRPRL
jgi:hypothetical protein